MKNLPIGIQTFRDIIVGDYIYEDKTKYIYALLATGKYYFLSRPRRFGKSLLLDTVAEAFGGDRELFKGLWIYDSDYDWSKHPVIRLDMSNIPNDTAAILKESLLDELNAQSEREGIVINSRQPASALKRMIESLHKKYGQRVVVLIDEYDKPMLDHIADPKRADANRKVLGGFYGVLKSMDPYLRFTMITGVSKFSKTSVFSQLNNLTDISMERAYAGVCGIPAENLDKLFSAHIKELHDEDGLRQFENIEIEILKWYNGYSWDGETKLLNPFSLLSFFRRKEFSVYWYATGTPRFLLDLIRKNPESYLRIRDTRITEEMLDSVEIEKITIEPLLFQTGYLTVKNVQRPDGIPVYTLDMPNYEVRRAFNLYILSALSEIPDVQTWQMRTDVGDALRTGDLTEMLDILRGFFASIPYNLHEGKESYYHSMFYALLSGLGFSADLEVSTAKGRSDAILELDDRVYIFEFKYRSCPKNASAARKRKLFDEALDEGMAQIEDRGYGDKYQGSGKIVHKAVFAFVGRGEIDMRSPQEPA